MSTTLRLLLPVLVLLLPAAARAQNPVATWIGSSTVPSGTDVSWADPAHWDTAVFPNNGNGGSDWDVVLSAPSPVNDPFLAQPITIDALTGGDFDVDLIGNTLTVEGATTLGDDARFFDGTLVLNGTLDLSATNRVTFGAALVVHAGGSLWTDPELLLSDGPQPSTFRNDGILAAESFAFMREIDKPRPSLENHGTMIQAVGFGEMQAHVENHGLIDVSGWLTLGDSDGIGGLPEEDLTFRQVDGILRLRPGSIVDDDTGLIQLDIEGGRLEAEDTGVRVPIELGGTLAPGIDGPGIFRHLDGFFPADSRDDLRMLPGSSLEIELAGDATGQYDRVYGQDIHLDGDLVVTFLNGFNKQVNSSTTLIILSANDALTGEFANAPDGTRLSAQGASFRVDYLASSVRLADFKPKRKSCGLGAELVIVLPLLAMARRLRA